MASAVGSTATERVQRHLLIDRIYHWAMAIAVFTLMVTAFFPIFGIKFEWLSIHWITGVILTLLVLVHIVRAVFFQDPMAMVIDLKDIKGALSSDGGKPGKYNALQKLFHLGVAFFILCILGSGLTMLLKIDTPLWRRNPYIFANESWGLIYALHDLAAMAMVAMVMIHVYFAFRPEEFYLLRSMLRGWISRGEYKAHHDETRWKAE